MLFICPKCSTEQDALSAKIEKHFLPNGGYHLKALCYQCGFFIKNLPHSLPQILHFGKYKDKPIAVVARENPAYLRWLCSQDIKPNLKQSILSALEKADSEHSQRSFSL